MSDHVRAFLADCERLGFLAWEFNTCTQFLSIGKFSRYIILHVVYVYYRITL